MIETPHISLANTSSQQDIGATWAQEAEERIAAYERGEVEEEPVEMWFNVCGPECDHGGCPNAPIQ